MVTLKQTTLFQSREEGYHTYRIPGVAAVRGAVLAFCEARKESPWDDGPTDLVIRRSVDNGESWDAMRVLVPGFGATAHNATMIADPTRADLLMLYCIDYRRAFVTQSLDAGLTFGPANEITHVFEQYRAEYNWRMIAAGPGGAVRLANGRLVVPIWMSTDKAQKPTAASVIFSDDHGVNWSRGPIVVHDDDGQGVANPMEPVLVELRDGGVMMNVRNASPGKRRAVSISPDGVRDWLPFVFDPGLPEPFCQSSIARLSMKPGDALDAIVYVGPDDLSRADQPGTANVGGCDRKRVTVRLSDDEGKTWRYSRVLEPGWSGYSGLAVGADKTVFCLYESGCFEERMWEVRTLCMARFGAEWVME